MQQEHEEVDERQTFAISVQPLKAYWNDYLSQKITASPQHDVAPRHYLSNVHSRPQQCFRDTDVRIYKVIEHPQYQEARSRNQKEEHYEL